MRSLGYRQYTTGYTTLDADLRATIFLCHVTGNLNRSIAYGQDTCRAYQKSTASVDAFAVNVSVLTSFLGFSHDYAWVNAQLRRPSATTNPFVFIPGSESGSEPKSRSMSTQMSEWHVICVSKPITKTLWRVKRKKIIDHRVRGQNVIFCPLTTKKSTASDRLSLAPNWGILSLWSGT